MFTSYDKAIVAGIMALIGIVDLYFGWGFSEKLNEETVAAIVMLLVPFFVWLVPNKET
jgi:membrane-bound ClpP family serine protease